MLFVHIIITDFSLLIYQSLCLIRFVKQTGAPWLKTCTTKCELFFKNAIVSEALKSLHELHVKLLNNLLTLSSTKKKSPKKSINSKNCFTFTKTCVI